MRINRFFLQGVFVCAIAFCIALAPGCGGAMDGPRGTDTFQKEGWKPFSTARTGDGPGRIYRVDSQGAVFQVTSLKVTPRSDQQQTYAVSDTAELSLGEVLEAIDIPSVDLPISVKAKLEEKSLIKTESISATREYLEDRDITEQVLSEGFVGIKIREDNKYYLVRETLSSNSLKFQITKSWLTDLGVDIDFESIVKSKTYALSKTGNDVSVDAKFENPHRIWYKAERLILTPSLGAGPDQPPTVKRDPADNKLKLPAKTEDVP